GVERTQHGHSGVATRGRQHRIASLLQQRLRRVDALWFSWTQTARGSFRMWVEQSLSGYLWQTPTVIWHLAPAPRRLFQACRPDRASGERGPDWRYRFAPADWGDLRSGQTCEGVPLPMSLSLRSARLDWWLPGPREVRATLGESTPP